MQQAIDLAWGGLYTTRCNPRVGCVLVKDGESVASGFHLRPGEPHAEVNALRAAGERARGATAYVTLEPCNHTGKTPPCTRALVDAGVTRVVAAMVDPNPLVSGKGIEVLRAAGIEVDIGLLEAAARHLNPGFIKRMETGLPWVRVKLAMSLDGRTAMASGESQWITGPVARSDVQRWRARSCAVVTGVGTVLADDPALTVRPAETGLPAGQAALAAERQPLRVVLDSQLQTPPGAQLLQQRGDVLIISGAEAPAGRRQALQSRGAEVIASEASSPQLRQVLELLAGRQCNEVLVEAGPTLAGAMLAAGLVDELLVYMAPTLLGSEARPLLELPLQRMAEQQRLTIESISAVGEDWRIIARPAAQPSPVAGDSQY